MAVLFGLRWCYVVGIGWSLDYSLGSNYFGTIALEARIFLAVLASVF